MGGLGQELLFWLEFVTNWMLLADGLSGRVTVGFGKEVFTNQTFDVTGVSWHLLGSDHVVGSTGPILSKSAVVSENLFVFVNEWGVLIAVKTAFLRVCSIQSNWMLTAIVENLSFNLSSSCSVSFVLARNMASVTREIFFFCNQLQLQESSF